MLSAPVVRMPVSLNNYNRLRNFMAQGPPAASLMAVLAHYTQQLRICISTINESTTAPSLKLLEWPELSSQTILSLPPIPRACVTTAQTLCQLKALRAHVENL